MEEIPVLTSPAAPVKAAARALSTVGNPLLAYFTSLVRCEPPPLPGDSVLPQSFVASRLYGHHIFPRNLATQETLSMLPTDSLTQTTTVRALHALNKHGYCLLRGVLTEAEVSLASAAVESLFERQQAVEKARRASRQTPGAWMLQEDDMAEQAPFIEVRIRFQSHEPVLRAGALRTRGLRAHAFSVQMLHRSHPGGFIWTAGNWDIRSP
eukprot:5590693-Pleurochrysis_carterae.AAC.3